jgi:hypothetical protein
MVDGQRVKSSHEGLGSSDGRDLKLRGGLKMDSLEILYNGGRILGKESGRYGASSHTHMYCFVNVNNRSVIL